MAQQQAVTVEMATKAVEQWKGGTKVITLVKDLNVDRSKLGAAMLKVVGGSAEWAKLRAAGAGGDKAAPRVKGVSSGPGKAKVDAATADAKSLGWIDANVPVKTAAQVKADAVAAKAAEMAAAVDAKLNTPKGKKKGTKSVATPRKGRGSKVTTMEAVVEVAAE